MNDFTKEELEWLQSDHWSCGANFEGLYEKLQSLIDNYCEHLDSNISFVCEDCGRIE